MKVQAVPASRNMPGSARTPRPTLSPFGGSSRTARHHFRFPALSCSSSPSMRRNEEERRFLIPPVKYWPPLASITSTDAGFFTCFSSCRTISTCWHPFQMSHPSKRCAARGRAICAGMPESGSNRIVLNIASAIRRNLRKNGRISVKIPFGRGWSLMRTSGHTGWRSSHELARS